MTAQPASQTDRAEPGPSPAGGSRTVSFRPATLLLERLLRITRADILADACERWEVSPASSLHVRKAKVLPGQLERIEGTEFGTIDEVLRDFRGDFESLQPATMAYRVKDVLFHDGILSTRRTRRHLRRRTGYAPIARAPREERRAALYESWLGNRWFGNWLSDDCLTYPLARQYGTPFTSHTTSGHMADYEAALAMRPARAASTSFDELVLFEDKSDNAGKRDRAEAMRRRLVGSHTQSHPGVFLLRGQSGDARLLLNEQALAETLATRRGFTILDPSRASVAQIAQACGGARVVAGVEGSHLVHGLAAMPRDACAFVIQPPGRAVSALKLLTDRQGQDYALVVAKGCTHAFNADIDEVERTLDLT